MKKRFGFMNEVITVEGECPHCGSELEAFKPVKHCHAPRVIYKCGHEEHRHILDIMENTYEWKPYFLCPEITIQEV